MKAPDLLEAAARLIERARGFLTADNQNCDTCGHAIHTTEGRVDENLADIPEKLRRNAAKLKGL